MQEFRKMRRADKEKSAEWCRALLEEGTRRHWAGMLGLNGENGYPYVVPVDYIYDRTCDGDHIWFHSARRGLKLECIKKDPRICMTVAAKDQEGRESYMLSAEQEAALGRNQDYTCHFGSVVVYGKARIVEDEGKKLEVLDLLNRQRTPEFYERGRKEIEMQAKHCCVVEIEIEHMTGKGI
ncbi:MAG: pyridoxamine 5'-phosphate oxidase family protein [Clostridia bacterium]|nr:pyridoxamine 5'-phosphate oxidase family protein [Clostridia bacterium]